VYPSAWPAVSRFSSFSSSVRPAGGDRRTWRAFGELLRRDVERLKNHVGLVERQIVVALPKLSAEQIEDLLEHLRAEDPTIARTILNTALDAADPRLESAECP
jgi:hypothetical protein